MRTEGSKRSLVFISLAFALVLSMAIVATPVLAPAVISEPGGTTIEVDPGQEFVLSFRLEWDEIASGYYAIPISWRSPRVDDGGTPSENFTFVDASAYFVTGDNVGESIDAPLDETASNLVGAVDPENENLWLYTAVIGNPTRDDRNGEFIVNIRFRATGAGGVPHIPTDNHPVVISGTIDVTEDTWHMYSPPNPYITVRVVLTPPTLLTPIDGTLTKDNAPTFEWENTPYVADNYEIWVDNDPNFSSPVPGFPYNTTDNFYEAPGLADENYSWKVRAYSGADFSDSEVWTFLIDTLPPTKPTLVWPTDGEDINDNTPNLGWEAVIDPSGVTYDVQVDNDSDFLSPIENDTGVVDENYQVTLELAEGTWYWRVCAVDGAGNPGAWADNTFTVTALPSQPVLYSPANGAITNDNMPTFEWTNGVNADNHRLLVDNDSDFLSAEIDNTILVPENSFSPTVGLADETYYWKVIAQNAAGENESVVRTFIVDVTPPIVTLPAYVPDPTNDSTPTYSGTATYVTTDFDDVVDIEYRVDEGDWTDVVAIEELPAPWVDFTFTTPELSDGIHLIEVRAQDEAGNWSVVSDTLTVDTTPPPRPTMVWPADGENINDNTPNLDWDAVSEISLPVTYDVWVDNDSDFSSPTVSATGITDDNYQVTTELDEGVYYWRVQATDNAGNVGENSQRSFRVDITAPTAPTLLEPADGTVTTDSTPTFRWTAVTDMSTPVTYELQVDNDAGFGSPEINVPRLADNAYTPTNALADKNYSWRVRAMDNAGNTGDWSTSWTLLIGVARSVDVSISPSHQSGVPGATLSYTVTVMNTGNVADNYDLTVSDDAVPSWNPTVSPTSLLIAAGASGTATVSVTIPEGTAGGTEDEMTVEATSRTDSMVSDSATFTAQATALRGVKVSMSPESKSGAPGETLTYTITVKNTGSIVDTYTLSAAVASEWLPRVENTSLTLGAGEVGETTLTVTIPPGESEGTSMTINVSARSQGDTTVIGSDTCRTIVTGAPVVTEVELAVPLVISAFLIGAAILVMAYLLRVRPKKAARRRVLSDVSLGSRY